MTFGEATVEVLRGASRPLSTREVADAVVRSGKVAQRGKTPEKTVSAVLYGLTRSPDNPGVERVAEEGPRRARRGTVRWFWRR
jgi:hypothetical protein